MPSFPPRLRRIRPWRAVALAALVLLVLAAAWSGWSRRTTAQETACVRGRPLLAAGTEGLLAPFPGLGDDSAPSIGKFRLAIEPRFRPLLEGMPGYDPATGNLDSPVLSDRQTTIGRSAPLVNGSPEDGAGVPVGSAGVMVSDADMRVVPNSAAFPDVPGAREIHTAIKRFELRGTVGGVTVIRVRAGTDFPELRLSAGEVRAMSTSGAAAEDLPARSFFNVYTEVDLPPNPAQPLAFLGATVYNDEPLLIQNDFLDSLPPRVVYTHEGPEAVAVLFKEDNGEVWSAGDRLGYLTLAGHGMCFTNTAPDVAILDGVLKAHAGIPTPPPPTATPTATDTPIPTDTPTDLPSPTATATHTPPPSPTVTATPSPRPLHLPLTLLEQCRVSLRSLDLALVVDTSSSMAGASIDAARAAALAFVAPLRLGRGDQVALVTFDGAADLALPLSPDRHRVEAALGALRVTGSGTAIDLGVRRAGEELGGPRHRPGNVPVLVLLTDGRQTGGPAAALAAAGAARAAGITIYTIGLGGDVDAATLRAMAGAEERAFLSPTPEDLDRIYRDLAGDLACPGQSFWPRQP